MRFRTRNVWKGISNGNPYAERYMDDRYSPPYIFDTIPSTTEVFTGPRVIETMEDLRGPKKARKPCLHDKVSISFEGSPSTIPFVRAGSGGHITYTYTSLAYGDRLLDVLCGNQAANSFSGCSLLTTSSSFVGPDWFSLLSKFRDQVDNVIPRDFFLLEFLSEYKIFLDSFKLLLNPTRAIKSLMDLHRLLKRKPSTLGKMSTISRSVASGYLGYNFGVKPAIKDIRSILSSFQRIEKRMQYLRERAGQWIPIRVQEVIPCSITDNGWPSYDLSSKTFARKTIEKHRVASISGLAQVRDLTNNPLSVYSAYSSFFGINDVVSLAWELVPFSFVVDWFTNTQERINSIFKSKDSPFTAIKDLTFTLKSFEREAAYVSPQFWLSSIQSNSGFLDWTLLATRETSSYDRTTKCPDTSGVIDLSHLGLFHGLTFGALLFQKLR